MDRAVKCNNSSIKEQEITCELYGNVPFTSRFKNIRLLGTLAVSSLFPMLNFFFLEKLIL